MHNREICCGVCDEVAQRRARQSKFSKVQNSLLSYRRRCRRPRQDLEMRPAQELGPQGVDTGAKEEGDMAWWASAFRPYKSGLIRIRRI